MEKPYTYDERIQAYRILTEQRTEEVLEAARRLADCVSNLEIAKRYLKEHLASEDTTRKKEEG